MQVRNAVHSGRYGLQLLTLMSARFSTLDHSDDDFSDDDETLEDQQHQAALAIIGAVYGGVLVHRQARSDLRNPRRTYLTRRDLHDNPRTDSSWQRLYAVRSDRAFITTMGIDVATFEHLLESGFRDAWNTTAVPRNDVDRDAPPLPERRSLDAAGALGLLLHHLNSTMREVSLQQIFALTPAVVSRYLEFAAWILLRTLREMVEAEIRWPSRDEMDDFSILITARHPLLDGAFGCLDGLNLPIEVSEDPFIENMTYNGWLHGHFCSNVFGFSPEGTIITCVLNAPGSWHDSNIAEPIYEKLWNLTPNDYYLVADTAFPRGPDSIQNKIRAPLKANDRLPEDVEERRTLLKFTRQLLSYRQAAEWGMRAIQGSFGRLRLPLSVDKTKRLEFLELCVRLFNVRVRCVGINQIRSTYVPLWRDEDTQVWDEFESMMFPEIRRRDRVSRFHCVYEDDE